MLFSKNQKHHQKTILSQYHHSKTHVKICIVIYIYIYDITSQPKISKNNTKPASKRINFCGHKKKNCSLTPWKFNSSPLKIGRAPIGKDLLPTTIFQGRTVKLQGCITMMTLKTKNGQQQDRYGQGYQQAVEWE